MGRLLARAAGAIVLLSACTTSDPGPSTSASEATGADPPAESIEPAASEAAPSEPAASGPCMPPDLCGDELTPGEYTSTVGSVPLRFTVDEGWRGTQYGDLGFDVVRLGAGEPQLMSAVPYGGVVYSDVCSGAETEEVGATAADFIAFVAGRPGITARAEPIEVTVGGWSGQQVDVDVADPGCVSEPPERLWLWDVQGVTDFHLNIGEAARLLAVDGDAGVIVFVIETFDPATFDALLELTQPILDSMTAG